MPRADRPGDEEDSGVALVEPAATHRAGEAAAVQIQFGGLATGEHTVLRGRELNDGAHGVVQHSLNATPRVSRRNFFRPATALVASGGAPTRAARRREV